MRGLVDLVGYHLPLGVEHLVAICKGALDILFLSWWHDGRRRRWWRYSGLVRLLVQVRVRVMLLQLVRFDVGAPFEVARTLVVVAFVAEEDG